LHPFGFCLVVHTPRYIYTPPLCPLVTPCLPPHTQDCRLDYIQLYVGYLVTLQLRSHIWTLDVVFQTRCPLYTYLVGIAPHVGFTWLPLCPQLVTHTQLPVTLCDLVTLVTHIHILHMPSWIYTVYTHAPFDLYITFGYLPLDSFDYPVPQFGWLRCWLLGLHTLPFYIVQLPLYPFPPPHTHLALPCLPHTVPWFFPFPWLLGSQVVVVAPLRSLWIAGWFLLHSWLPCHVYIWVGSTFTHLDWLQVPPHTPHRIGFGCCLAFPHSCLCHLPWVPVPGAPLGAHLVGLGRSYTHTHMPCTHVVGLWLVWLVTCLGYTHPSCPLDYLPYIVTVTHGLPSSTRIPGWVGWFCPTPCPFHHTVGYLCPCPVYHTLDLPILVTPHTLRYGLQFYTFRTVAPRLCPLPIRLWLVYLPDLHCLFVAVTGSHGYGLDFGLVVAHVVPVAVTQFPTHTHTLWLHTLPYIPGFLVVAHTPVTLDSLWVIPFGYTRLLPHAGYILRIAFTQHFTHILHTLPHATYTLLVPTRTCGFALVGRWVRWLGYRPHTPPPQDCPWLGYLPTHLICSLRWTPLVTHTPLIWLFTPCPDTRWVTLDLVTTVIHILPHTHGLHTHYLVTHRLVPTYIHTAPTHTHAVYLHLCYTQDLGLQFPTHIYHGWIYIWILVVGYVYGWLVGCWLPTPLHTLAHTQFLPQPHSWTAFTHTYTYTLPLVPLVPHTFGLDLHTHGCLVPSSATYPQLQDLPHTPHAHTHYTHTHYTPGSLVTGYTVTHCCLPLWLRLDTYIHSWLPIYPICHMGWVPYILHTHSFAPHLWVPRCPFGWITYSLHLRFAHTVTPRLQFTPPRYTGSTTRLPLPHTHGYTYRLVQHILVVRLWFLYGLVILRLRLLHLWIAPPRLVGYIHTHTPLWIYTHTLDPHTWFVAFPYIHIRFFIWLPRLVVTGLPHTQLRLDLGYGCWIPGPARCRCPFGLPRWIYVARLVRILPDCRCWPVYIVPLFRCWLPLRCCRLPLPFCVLVGTLLLLLEFTVVDCQLLVPLLLITRFPFALLPFTTFTPHTYLHGPRCPLPLLRCCCSLR